MVKVWYCGVNSPRLGRRVSRHEGTPASNDGRWLLPYPGRSDRYRWGEESPQAVNLAHALIFDATGDVDLADKWELAFADLVVSRLPEDRWQIDAGELAEVLDFVDDVVVVLDLVAQEAQGVK